MTETQPIPEGEPDPAIPAGGDPVHRPQVQPDEVAKDPDPTGGGGGGQPDAPSNGS